MYNSATIAGNVGDEPKLTYTQAGTAVAKFSVATSERRKDKDGNAQEKTTWHRVVAFGKLGEICGEYLKKGSQVLVVGKIENGMYEKDGQKHYTSEIMADTMKMLGKREGGERTQREAPQRRAPSNPASEPPLDDFADDDIPF